MEADRRLLPWSIKRDAAGPILHEAEGEDHAVVRRDRMSYSRMSIDSSPFVSYADLMTQIGPEASYGIARLRK